MSLNVIYTGSSSTLLTSDIVMVKKKPGILNENIISDYLLNYSNADIKEGILRPGNEDNTYVYDLNDAKVMQYDLLIFVRGNVVFNSTTLREMEGIGYIDLPRMGLASSQTHEVINIKYTILDSVVYGNVLTYNYDKSSFIISNYLVNAVSGKSVSLTRSNIDSLKFNHRLSTAMEAQNSAIAPALSGYIYNNKYYENLELNLNLVYSTNSVTKLDIRNFSGNDWLEIRYSNNEILLHNISVLPKVSTPLIDSVNGVDTIKISCPSYTDIVASISNLVYKNTLGQWVFTYPYYTPTEMLDNDNRIILKPNLLPGYKEKDGDCSIVYSDVTSKTTVNWCDDKEIMDRLYQLNVDDSNNMASGVWENSTLAYYRLLNANPYFIVLNKFSETASRIEVYFEDKTMYSFSSTLPYRILDKGEIMIKTGASGFIILSNSANNVTTISNVYDLAKYYFSSFNSLITEYTITFENTVIYGGKYYSLINNKLS